MRQRKREGCDGCTELLDLLGNSWKNGADQELGYQIAATVWVLPFLPLHCLNQPLGLLLESEDVFMPEDRSWLCLPGLWEECRGGGQGEGGRAVVLQAAAEQHCELCSALPSAACVCRH